MRRLIRAVGLVEVAGDRLLLVRPARKGAFYLPGGKPEPGESDLDALRREVREELGVDVPAASCRPAGVVTAPAYGEGDDVTVRLACFTGTLAGTPTPSAEIAELGYFTPGEYQAQPEQAPAIRVLMRRLFPASDDGTWAAGHAAPP